MYSNAISRAREIATEVESISGMFQLDCNLADVILRHFNWNKPALEICIIDEGIPSILKKAGLQKFSSEELDKRVFGITQACAQRGSNDSDLCYCGRSIWFALNCDHWYCSSCYKDHFQSTLTREGSQV